MRQDLKGFLDVFGGREDTVQCQHCCQWWQEWGYRGIPQLCLEESDSLWEESTGQGSGVRHSSSHLPNGAADPKPALIPGASCTPCASQGHSGCLGALPHATAHTAPGSPLPASQHGLASPASPLKLGFKAGTGLHKVLAGLQTRPVSHFFCCSMTRKPK